MQNYPSRLLNKAMCYFRYHHNVKYPDEIETTEAPGYWQFKKPCGPDCLHPMHSFLGCEAPTQHTIAFIEPQPRDEFGRFMSPFRAWHAWKKYVKTTKDN